MHYDKELIAHKLNRWETYMHEYQLPDWEHIPDFGLYMDQVMTLLGEFLDFIPAAGEKPVTASTINNYVRLKVMPPPVRKKYYRVHLAYLLIILTLKQSMSISSIQQFLPPNASQEEVCAIYTAFSRQLRAVAVLFTDQVRAAAQDLLAPEAADQDQQTNQFVIQYALMSGFSRTLADKMSRLRDADTEAVLRAEQEKAQGHHPAK
jgi:DNA-binding transcriptional MerR regulator